MPPVSGIREVNRLSRLNDGVLVGGELRKVLTRDQIRSLVARGHISRLFRDIYRDEGVRATPRQALRAAVAAGGRHAAAGHRSAAALWGLLTAWPDPPELVVPLHVRPRVPGIVVRRSTDLCRAHISWRSGIAVTNPLVTILDLGAVEGPTIVAEAIARGSALRLFRPVAVDATLARLARSGRTGVSTVKAALDLLPDGRRPTDGMLELRFGQLVRRFGLPPCEFQYRIVVDGKEFRIDFAFPVARLAIEVDDYLTHGTPSGFEYDRQRQNLLILAGWTVLRFTYRAIRHAPERVATQIRDALHLLGGRATA